MCLCVTKSFLFSGFVWEITDGGFCDHPKPVMSAPFFRVARLVHGFSPHLSEIVPHKENSNK